MDAIVEAALKKWPNVPACTGWLGLDARGQWWMRDAACQAQGSFQAGCAAGDMAMKGSLLKHNKLIAFIQRNYGVDEKGCAWFQNGPQRVFVELEAAPYSLRLHENGRITATAGSSASENGQHCVAATDTFLDEHGHLYLSFAKSAGTPPPPVMASVAKPSTATANSRNDGLPRRFAPRNDEAVQQPHQTLGRVHSQDMLLALAAIEDGRLPTPTETSLANLQTQFAFVLSPQAAGAA